MATSAKHSLNVREKPILLSSVATGISADFWLLWAGQFVSRVGSAMTSIAVPLIAINVLKATSVDIGLLAAVQSTPALLLALVGGLLADRISKRSIMLVTESGRALILLSVGLCAATGHLTMMLLYGLMFMAGALGVFFEVSHAALIPVLVEARRLISANTATQGGRTASSLAGRSLGGVVVAVWSASAAMYMDALSYVMSFFSILLIRWREPDAVVTTRKPSAWRDLAEGFRFVRDHQSLRTILGYAASANLFTSALFAIYIFYLSAELHISAVKIGIIFSMLTTGSLIGTVSAPQLNAVLQPGNILKAGGMLASCGTAILICHLHSPMGTVVLQSCGLMVVGSSLALININVNSFIQGSTPQHLMARIVGTTQVVSSIMLPIGAFVSGLLSKYMGSRTALAFSAAGLLVTTLLLHWPKGIEGETA